MEIIPDRLSVYTTTQIYVLIFISGSNHNATVSKVTRNVSDIGFHNNIFLVWILMGVICMKFDFT